MFKFQHAGRYELQVAKEQRYSELISILHERLGGYVPATMIATRVALYSSFFTKNSYGVMCQASCDSMCHDGTVYVSGLGDTSVFNLFVHRFYKPVASLSRMVDYRLALHDKRSFTRWNRPVVSNRGLHHLYVRNKRAGQALGRAYAKLRNQALPDIDRIAALSEFAELASGMYNGVEWAGEYSGFARKYLETDINRFPLPWAQEDWYTNSPHAARRAYVSMKDPGKVAYFESFDKACRNLYTVTKPGRYLTKFFSDVLSDKDIKYWAEKFAALSESTKLHFVPNTDPDGWEWVYENAHGFTSCMQYKRDGRYLDCGLYGQNHPVRAYAHPENDLALAYIGDPVGTDGGKVYGRSIVNTAEMSYVRIYGSDQIRAALEVAGYRDRGCLIGQKLHRRSGPNGGIICPYLDEGSVVIYSDHLEVSDYGKDTSSSGVIMACVCPHCYADLDDREDLRSGYSHTFCVNCEDDFVLAYVNSDYKDYVPVNEAVEVGGEWYLDDDHVLSQHNIHRCDECDELFEGDDGHMTSRGYVCDAHNIVGLEVPDPDGNEEAFEADTKEALDEDGNTVIIHEDTPYSAEYRDPEAAEEPVEEVA